VCVCSCVYSELKVRVLHPAVFLSNLVERPVDHTQCDDTVAQFAAAVGHAVGMAPKAASLSRASCRGRVFLALGAGAVGRGFCGRVFGVVPLPATSFFAPLAPCSGHVRNASRTEATSFGPWGLAAGIYIFSKLGTWERPDQKRPCLREQNERAAKKSSHLSEHRKPTGAQR